MEGDCKYPSGKMMAMEVCPAVRHNARQSADHAKGESQAFIHYSCLSRGQTFQYAILQQSLAYTHQIRQFLEGLVLHDLAVAREGRLELHVEAIMNGGVREDVPADGGHGITSSVSSCGKHSICFILKMSHRCGLMAVI